MFRSLYTWPHRPLLFSSIIILCCGLMSVTALTIWKPGGFLLGKSSDDSSQSDFTVFGGNIEKLFIKNSSLSLVTLENGVITEYGYESALDLDAHFRQMDYLLANVRNFQNFVPRLYLKNLPPDIADIESIKKRKQFFIKAILPVILRINEDIIEARERLTKLKKTSELGIALTKSQNIWINRLAERYETTPEDWDSLLSRIDIVPPSLAIAQAAEESGWGTSRFAREGNALFGQYTFVASDGMLPEKREHGEQHLIRSYSSLFEAVGSYMHNLNYHPAYAEFRQERKYLRDNAMGLDGIQLVGKLIRYSERGTKYIEAIRHIIRSNDLSPLDHARLHEDGWT